MINKLLLFIFLSISISVKAHQPDVSTTILVEKENNVWVLQISASLSAFQQEIKTHFYETPYKTPEEFQKMVIEHVKKNIEIEFNDGQLIMLSEGFVKLGHETKVVFEVFGVPSDMKSVFIKNTSFTDIHKSQSNLVLLKEDFDKEHFVLNKENNHTLRLLADQNKFIIETENKASFLSVNLLYLLMGIAALIVLYKILTRKDIK